MLESKSLISANGLSCYLSKKEKAHRVNQHHFDEHMVK